MLGRVPLDRHQGDFLGLLLGLVLGVLDVLGGDLGHVEPHGVLEDPQHLGLRLVLAELRDREQTVLLLLDDVVELALFHRQPLLASLELLDLPAEVLLLRVEALELLVEHVLALADALLGLLDLATDRLGLGLELLLAFEHELLGVDLGLLGGGGRVRLCA